MVTMSQRTTARRRIRGLLCLLGRHDPATSAARNVGERWWTRLHYCRRCMRLIDAGAGKD